MQQALPWSLGSRCRPCRRETIDASQRTKRISASSTAEPGRVCQART
jgi:hypothetical protein